MEICRRGKEGLVLVGVVCPPAGRRRSGIFQDSFLEDGLINPRLFLQLLVEIGRQSLARYWEGA
jgi:hypothetical protein